MPFSTFEFRPIYRKIMGIFEVPGLWDIGSEARRRQAGRKDLAWAIEHATHPVARSPQNLWALALECHTGVD